MMAGCPTQAVNSDFQRVFFPGYLLDTLQQPFIQLLLTANAFQVNNNYSETLTYCRNIYCPADPPLDTCLRSFYKEYRDPAKGLFFWDVEKTANDQLLVTGGSIENPYDGRDQSIISLFDTTGRLLNVKRLDFPNPAYFYHTIRLRDNNFLAYGLLWYDSDTLDQMLVKFDSQLNIIWSKKIHFPVRFRQFQQVIESDEGDIYCYLDKYANIGPVEKRYLFKLNSTGNLVWIKRYDASTAVFPWSDELDGILGETTDHILLKFTPVFDSTAFILKIRKSDGQAIWSKRYRIDNTPGYQFNAIKFITLNNSVYLFYQRQNPALLKLDFDGNVLQSSRLTMAANTGTYDVKVKDPGHFLFTTQINQPGLFAEGILEVDTSYNVTRQKLIHASVLGNPDGLVPFSDSITYAVGYHLQGDYMRSGVLQKYNFNTSPGICSIPDMPNQTLTVPFAVTSFTPVTEDEVAPEITDLLPGILAATINYSTPHCNGNPACSQLNIAGSSGICDSVNVYTYNIIRNPGCSGPVYWVIDSLNNQLTIIEQTDNYIKIKARINGVIKIRAQIFGGCEWLKDSLTINILLNNATLNLGADSSLCPGNTRLLHAGPGFLNYLWQDGTTDSTLLVTAPGIYFVQVTDACNNIANDTIVLAPSPPIPFDIGPDLTKCNTDSLTITAPAGFLNYTWNFNYNISSTTGQSVIVFPYVDTIYKVAAEKTPGCFAYDSVRIHVNHSPPINLGRDTSFCEYDSLTVDAGNGFQTYQWNIGAISQSITIHTAGTYSVMAVDVNGCRSYDTLTVPNVYSKPVVILSKDSTICSGAGQQLTPGTGFASYLWSTGSNANTITINNAGNYWVSIVDNNGCKGSDSTKITTILPAPFGFLPSDTFVCNYMTIQVKPLSAFNSYLWSTGSSANNIIVGQANTYWLQVKDNNDCIGRDSIVISPKQCLEGFYIPTAFTPGKDGKNDLFYPLLFGNVVKYKFSIYNRWGQKVFETTTLQRGWDGTLAGTTTDTNVFVWICTYQFAGQPLETKKGTVVLIR